MGDAYDFKESGAGDYKVQLARNTLWVTLDGGKTTSVVKIPPKKHSVTISGTLSAPRKAAKAARRLESGLDRRSDALNASATNFARTIELETRAMPIPVSNQCNTEQVAIIQVSAYYADNFAAESLT